MAEGVPDRMAWLTAHLLFEGDIYGEAADRVLDRLVAPFLASCRADGQEALFDRWFFLRYNLPTSHLRLRLGGDEGRLEPLRPLLTAAVAEASREGVVSGLEWAAYEPEVERYGGPWGLEVSERLFEVSSEAALALLAKVTPGDRPARLGKALLAMLVQGHVFLRAGGEDPRLDAARFAHGYAHGYLSALASDSRQLEEWLTAFERGFDRQADHLAPFVEAAWEALEAGEELTPELDTSRLRTVQVRDTLRRLAAEGKLAAPGPSWGDAVRHLLPSYWHMMNNRLGVGIQEEAYLAVLIHRTLAPAAIPWSETS